MWVVIQEDFLNFSHCKCFKYYKTQVSLELTWTTAFDPLTSRTWPDRTVPSARWSSTISAYLGNFTSSKITSGPLTPETVLYAENYNHCINKNEKMHPWGVFHLCTSVCGLCITSALYSKQTSDGSALAGARRCRLHKQHCYASNFLEKYYMR